MKMIPSWLDRLEQVTSTGKGYISRCPAHNDKHPSLNIDPGGKGWLIYCHRGCTSAEIMQGIGLSMAELYYDAGEHASKPPDPTRIDAEAFFDKETPWTPCIRLHTFNDVAYTALDRPIDTAWAEAMVSVYPYGTDRFDTTMTMWIVLRDSWLWTWVGTSWLARNGPKKDWREVTEWAASLMWKVWIEQGCSGCPLEESPKPVLGLG